ncbi:hypothetical protein WG66_007879 [Moniliophthora roreri]|nr:hypothetical protein WG66_007879 [Moniliophthora roreri]
MGLPRLPQEICDHVIHYCQDDTETLSACSLVSRAWVFKSRSVLFPESFIFTFGDHMRKTTKDFHALVKSPCCTITPSARHIAFVGRDNIDDLAILEDAILHLESSRLGRLKEIKFFGMFPSQLMNHPNLISSLSRCITSLTLDYSIWYHNHDLSPNFILQIMHLLGPTLESFCLSLFSPSGNWQAQTLSPFPKKARMARLRYLFLDAAFDYILPLFLIPGLVEFPRLSSLNTTMVYLEDDEHYLQDFLDSHCRGRLEELSFSVQPYHAYDVHLPAINLSRLDTLSTIRFNFRPYGPQHEGYHRKFVDIASSVPCSSQRALNVFVKDESFRLPSSAEILKDRVKWYVGKDEVELDQSK